MALPAFIIVFFITLILGLPIIFVMLLSSGVYFIVSGNLSFFYAFPERMYSGIDSFILMAVPFFLLAGEIMNRSEMSERLIEFANLIIGRVRGGLAQVNVLASILFAGLTGVALGDVAALGKIFIPTMEKQGYTRSFAAAVTGASSIVGPIIPPSAIIILYCAIMEISVGAMFVAAIIPGLMIGISDMIVVALLAKKRNFPVQRIPFTFKAFAISFSNASVAVVMPVLIIGGILGGLFTPTEAAACAVVYAIFIGFVITKKMSVNKLALSLKTASLESARLLIIIAAATVVSWIFAMESVDLIVAKIFMGFTQNKFALILAINILYLILGMWLDPGANIILFAPVIAPLAYKLGVHPFQLGIMLVINCNIGILTPPVGYVLFAIADISKSKISDLTKDLLPFLVVNIVVVLLVAFVPELTLWFPKLFGFII